MMGLLDFFKKNLIYLTQNLVLMLQHMRLRLNIKTIVLIDIKQLNITRVMVLLYIYQEKVKLIKKELLK